MHHNRISPGRTSTPTYTSKPQRSQSAPHHNNNRISITNSPSYLSTNLSYSSPYETKSRSATSTIGSGSKYLFNENSLPYSISLETNKSLSKPSSTSSIGIRNQTSSEMKLESLDDSFRRRPTNGHSELVKSLKTKSPEELSLNKQINALGYSTENDSPIILAKKLDQENYSWINSCPICNRTYYDQIQFENHVYNGVSQCSKQLKEIMSEGMYNSKLSPINDEKEEEEKGIKLNPKRVEKYIISPDIGKAEKKGEYIRTLKNRRQQEREKIKIVEEEKENRIVQKGINNSAKPTVNKKFVDRSFSCHWAYNAQNNRKVAIDKMAIISSQKDQFYFNGKSACTTIATEGAIYLLQEITNPSKIEEWNEKIIETIVKTGCMQDPQTGNMSFQEVFRQNKRFQSQLEIVNQGQDTTKSKESFKTMLDLMMNTAMRNRRSICAIITKQPETILLYYKYSENTQAFFIAFDSHSRTTDGIAHGAHMIYFLRYEDDTFKNVELYLRKWLFPYINFDQDGMDEMYNTFSYTFVSILRTKEGKPVEYSPFLIDSLENEDFTSLPSTPGSALSSPTALKLYDNSQINEELRKLREMNEKLENENKQKEQQITEYLEIIRKMESEKQEREQELAAYKHKIQEIRDKGNEYEKLLQQLIQFNPSNLFM